MAIDKPWGGRFSAPSSKLLEEFNASILIDRKLYKEDIFASKIHATMLFNIGILNLEEKNHIVSALGKIEREIEDGEFSFNIKDEDIHMAIEKRLIQLIGDIAKKLHTARSRNDQVATDFKIYVQANNRHISRELLNVIEVLLNIAREHCDTIMPGMTHLQHAQPISLAFHMLSYCCMFRRDFERLNSDYARHNFSPLGSAALAGTTYAIDREFCAKELGFKAPSLNAMDSVSERDFALDLLYSISVISLHLSRFAEELILWSSSEFGFINISDAFSTGSSIMPNKKNPDVCELIRGKSGRIFGNLFSLLTTMKALPLAYNKDMQEDKESVFSSVENILLSLKVFGAMMKEVKINKENMLKSAKIGHITATDLADYLVREKNISFRESHGIVGKIVAFAESKGCDISELSAEELCAQDSRISLDSKQYLDLFHSLDSRNCAGGTARSEVKKQLEVLSAWLNEAKSDEAIRG